MLHFLNNISTDHRYLITEIIPRSGSRKKLPLVKVLIKEEEIVNPGPYQAPYQSLQCMESDLANM
ncbi:hypothetical protein MA16_Dca026608 [Dendrobium catenatum]|uniref:Uncharacterized protein n=1 Tax=Dendrobium catenatum TaxID=906689 RepID=A0A2I0VH94_9ASPA|nr:hypothetical protein MA16_Dca026608 [Dendrobium catenatum]